MAAHNKTVSMKRTRKIAAYKMLSLKASSVYRIEQGLMLHNNIHVLKLL